MVVIATHAPVPATGANNRNFHFDNIKKKQPFVRRLMSLNESFGEKESMMLR